MGSMENKNIISENCKRAISNYNEIFLKYAFENLRCDTFEQFRASIIRWYHTIEKGLAYEDYRPGFGKSNVDSLIQTLKQYEAKGYDISEEFYKTAISCLELYIEKNKEYGYIDLALEQEVKSLAGESNNCGGAEWIDTTSETLKMDFETLMKSRHSIRHFSDKPVEMSELIEVINIAQYTPSACNRQGWRTIVISNKEKISQILSNQNGNRGFGEEIDKLLIVVSDLCAQQIEREYFQAFIDGGMYAESLLNALYYKNIAAIPLSASLTAEQEKNVRDIVGIKESEVLILFIGVGNYANEKCLVTRSRRLEPYIEVQ